MKEAVRKLLGPAMGFVGACRWGRRSYSQEGEDIVLDRLFEGLRDGFYVDIGCHHPFRFSNSYYFYRRGWQGICVDALPGTRKLFRRWRCRDIVVEGGISSKRGELTYHMFDEPALNTFDESLAQWRLANTNYRIIGSLRVPMDTLAAVLAAHCPIDQKIDFLSVDVEGLDLQVLESNDWGRYRPRIIVTECLNSDLGRIESDPVVRYLSALDYEPYAKTGNSVIFSTKAL